MRGVPPDTIDFMHAQVKEGLYKSLLYVAKTTEQRERVTAIMQGTEFIVKALKSYSGEPQQLAEYLEEEMRSTFDLDPGETL